MWFEYKETNHYFYSEWYSSKLKARCNSKIEVAVYDLNEEGKRYCRECKCIIDNVDAR